MVGDKCLRYFDGKAGRVSFLVRPVFSTQRYHLLMASIFNADALVEYTYSYLQSRAKRERKYGISTEMPPRGSVLRKIFSILFHSSLKTEEGRSIQVRVFYLNPAHPDVKDLEKVPEDRWRFYPLTSRIPLTTANLTK